MNGPYSRANQAALRITKAVTAAVSLMTFEDPASPVASSTDPGSSSGGSPTEGQALSRDTWSLDRIAAAMERWADAAERDLTALAPPARMPTRRCACCDDRMATHERRVTSHFDNGRTVTNRLDLCWWCADHHRRLGYLCSPQTHDGRPQLRMCECPDWCCDAGCPDTSAENRTLSERCRKRMSRAKAS